jgi:hypothetical protein
MQMVKVELMFVDVRFVLNNLNLSSQEIGIGESYASVVMMWGPYFFTPVVLVLRKGTTWPAGPCPS